MAAVEAGEHVADGGAVGRRHELDRGLGQSGALQAGDEGGMDGERRVEAFRAGAQDRRVAGLDGQRAGVGRHVGAAFVDDADDAERHAHALEAQAVGPRPFGQHRADRIGQLGDLLDALGHRFDARLVEQQPVDECRRAARPRARLRDPWRWRRGSPASPHAMPWPRRAAPLSLPRVTRAPSACAAARARRPRASIVSSVEAPCVDALGLVHALITSGAGPCRRDGSARRSATPPI